MSIATIRRQVKNVAYNFSDAQVKVCEATSNDPSTTSTTLVKQIADLSYNPSAFTEIMSIIWKRLNNHGKNWRHVYKSLELLQLLFVVGSEKVAAQCRENIYSIETLRDFQYVEEGRDQGMNVREKAKKMVALLRDEERLHQDRTEYIVMTYRVENCNVPKNLEKDERGILIGLALSMEDSETEKAQRKLALEESRKEAERLSTQPNNTVSEWTLSQSTIDDLLSLGLGQMTVAEPQPVQPMVNFNDRSNPVPPTQTPPPLYPSVPTPTANDPWSAPAAPAASVDPFSAWDAPAQNVQHNNVNSDRLPAVPPSNSAQWTTLIGGTQPHQNPFLLGSTPPAPVNPFTANQRKSPTLNEMRAGSTPTMPPTGTSTLLTQSTPIDIITISSDEEMEEETENERTKFMLTRNRFKQSSGVDHETRSPTSAALDLSPYEYDEARSGSLGEEEMQMQIADALKEQEREEEKRKREDVLYQLALEESRKEAECQPVQPMGSSAWDTPHFNDPWNPAPPAQAPPPIDPSVPTPTANDPWSAPPAPAASVDPFSAWDAPAQNVQHNNVNSDPSASLSLAPMQPLNGSSRMNTKTPETFLGENSSLVNLDNLMGGTAPAASKAFESTVLAAANPFLLGSTAPAPVNPFTANQRKSPTLDESGQPTLSPEDALQKRVAEAVAEAQKKYQEKMEKKKKALEEFNAQEGSPAARTRSRKRAALPSSPSASAAAESTEEFNQWIINEDHPPQSPNYLIHFIRFPTRVMQPPFHLQ